MADRAPVRAHLPSLPLELLDLILNEVENFELKTLRRTSKFLNKLSTPRLFARFVLYPHTRSFERLISISESDHLRHHVQRLDYDTTYLGVTPWLVKHSEAVWSEGIRPEDKKKVLKHARQLDSQRIRSSDIMDNLAQVHYLEQAFPALTNLKHLELCELGYLESTEPFFDRDSMPHFYKQMEEETCGQFPHTRLPRGPLGLIHSGLETYAHALLMAASKLPHPLEELRLYGVTWFNLLLQSDLSRHQPLFQKHLANLKSLCFVAGECQYFPGALAMTKFQNLLRAATNLEEFVLCVKGSWENKTYGHAFIDEGTGERISSMFQGIQPKNAGPVPAQLTWTPKLRYLDLYGLHCTAKEFKSVLKACVTTLESISLATIILLPESEDIECPRACWVKVFKWMQRHLKSPKFLNINGVLTNGGLQQWSINPLNEDPDCLRMKTYKFLLEGGPCPLEHLAIQPGDYDVKMKTHFDNFPVELILDKKYKGDESWHTEYNPDGLETDSDSFDYDDDDLVEQNPWGFHDMEDIDDDTSDDWDDEAGIPVGLIPPFMIDLNPP
ncbi:hypothetical protein H2198_007764 [Neophaeococcomyces mojaviensis]|uniref:Uncharacterized protein n=1 Tax=Neophaeococcomyces mojaviensis TaxID=3383035 RepID=A0ACC2ZZ66_9EURO|nr:hypothetical protein H2198_007764 [Knufia sp. JES_112]